eukprot:2112137-Rhodomonas_salina.2
MHEVSTRHRVVGRRLIALCPRSVLHLAQQDRPRASSAMPVAMSVPDIACRARTLLHRIARIA